MPTRYFFTANANRTIRAKSGLGFRFQMVDNVGGAWHGVLSTDKEDELEALDTLVASGTIREVSLEEFQAELEDKKKARRSQRSIKSAVPLPPVAAAQINPGPARLVDDPKATRELPDTDGPKADSIDDVLQVAKVIPPEAPKPKKKKAKQPKPSEDELPPLTE